MRIRKRKADVYLLVNALLAADLILSRDGKSPKSINAAVVVQLNRYRKRSKRRLNTANPSWDRQFAVPLRQNDYSQVLILSVWSKSSRAKAYLGEVRLCVSDLFGDDEGFKTQPKWFKLYSAEKEHSYITGSILLLFELSPKAHPASIKDHHAKENTKNTSTIAQSESHTKLQQLNLKDKPIDEMLKSWIGLLMVADVNASAVKPNEQGFYSADFEAQDILGASEVSDIESLDDEKNNPNGNRETQSEKPKLDLKINLDQLGLLGIPDDKEHAKSVYLLSSEALSACSFVSEGDSGSYSDVGIYSDSGLFSEGNDSKQKKKKFRRRKGPQKGKPQSKYELSKRSVKGVLFVEILTCSDLPPLRNFTRTTFDMDPFVVVTFGKKTFRTSWKRHTLNPVYNERLAFEVLDHEQNYDIQFSVLDRDQFSFHDQVADVTIPVQDMMNIALVPIKEVVKEVDIPAPSDTEKGPESTPNNSEAGTVFTPELKLEVVEFKLGFEPVLEKTASLSSFGSPSETLLTNSAMKLSENENLVKTKKKKLLRRRYTLLYVDTSLFKTLDLSLTLRKTKWAEKYFPKLKLRARFLTYESLRKEFWRVLLEQFNLSDTPGTMDYIELMSLFDTLGTEDSDEIVAKFFEKYKRSTWGGDVLDFEEIIDCMEDFVTSEDRLPGVKTFVFDRCPICCQERLSKKDDLDIITHFAICASKDWSIVNKLLVSSYETPQVATRRWFSKVLIKLTYGRYKLGSNSANILVQDRSTGIILEEKMSVAVRLGIRLLYRGLDKAKSKRVRILLRKLSIKQGIKFDNPRLKRDIDSFIKFHKLDLSDCLITDPGQFETFNDFFYRKLKPNARPIEGLKQVVVSPADCRCTTFNSVDEATELWIKGRNFTLARLFNGNFNQLENTSLYNPKDCCIGIFRLAPQDYHRFHSPVSGTIGPIKYIEGEYYTVNPMAIRSDLDVYGENVRVIIPIHTEGLGTVVMVAVGAMMVGSTIITVEEGSQVERGAEVGYFKFGGSTVLLLFEKKHLQFDSDIVENSKLCIETLVRVGQSIGHAPEAKEYKREHIDFDKQPQLFKLNLIRAITGGDISDTANVDSWESQNLRISPKDMDDWINDAELQDDSLIESRE